MGRMGDMGGGPPAQQQAQLPRDGRLAEAQALKAAGNKLHTEGNYEAASAKYNQARRAVTGKQEQRVNSSVTLRALGANATDLGQRVMFLTWPHLLTPVDGTSAEGKALVKACLLNLASCGLKLQRHGEVVQYTSEVLTSEPNNVKALYRRGQVMACALAASAPAAALKDVRMLKPQRLRWRARAASASTHCTHWA